MNWKLIDLKEISDERGSMIVAESAFQIPFEVKRLFYIYNVEPDAIRGDHANLFSEFVMICLKGNVKIWLSDGKNEIEYNLNDKSKALYMNKMIWKRMHSFSNDALLLCLTNTHYDSNEYIRNFSEFKNKKFE